MVMKQTVVEWLISHLQKSKDWQRVLNEVSQMSTIQFDLLEQAKEMEKEQIMDAYWDGGQDVPIHGIRCEQYYNETFKSE
jgi:HEPN domain-containing protein